MTATIAKLPAFSLGELVRIKRSDRINEWAVLFRSWKQLPGGEFYLEGFCFDTEERPLVFINVDLIESIYDVPLLQAS